MIRAQRLTAFRITRAYRTITVDAVLFLADTPTGRPPCRERKWINSKINDSDRTESVTEVWKSHNGTTPAAPSEPEGSYRSLRDGWRDVLRTSGSLSTWILQALSPPHRSRLERGASLLRAPWRHRRTLFDCPYWESPALKRWRSWAADIQDILYSPVDLSPRNKDHAIGISGSRSSLSIVQSVSLKWQKAHCVTRSKQIRSLVPGSGPIVNEELTYLPEQDIKNESTGRRVHASMSWKKTYNFSRPVGSVNLIVKIIIVREH